MQAWFSVLAGVLLLASYVLYIHSASKRFTMPMKSTWMILASLDTILAFEMYSKEVLNWHVIGAVFGSWTVAAFSFRNGPKGWDTTDKLCLTGAFLSLAVWIFTGDPMIGMMTTGVVMLFGAIPTAMSSWRTPEKEDKIAWIIGTVSCFFALAAVPDWKSAHVIQPVLYTLLEGSMALILLIREEKRTT